MLDIWEMVFALVIGDTLDDAASLDPDRSAELDFSGHGAALAVTLFLARPDGLAVAEVSEVIRAPRRTSCRPPRRKRPGSRGSARTAIPPGCCSDQMAELGAVRIADAEEARWPG